MIKVSFFYNGMQMAFQDGAQVPELQGSWILLWADNAKKAGYDPTKMDITMPNGMKVKIFETEEGGYNFQTQ